MSWVPPAAVIELLLVVGLSGLFYAFWPYRRRALLSVLLMTTTGVLLGQGWELLGLPALKLGEANLVPALVFAAALQPLAGRLTLRFPGQGTAV